jgi:CspA family cold shock protein
MPTGNVKWFDVKKGFGFIVGPDGQDVFVHFSQIGGDGFKTLKDGEVVEYELQTGEKGSFAREVRRVNPRPAMDGANAAAVEAAGAASAQPTASGA